MAKVERTLLWASDGTNDLSLSATSGRHHNFPLNAQNPSNDIVDSGGTNDYVQANLSYIDVDKYDVWGLACTFAPVQGTMTTTFSTSPCGLYAAGTFVSVETAGDATMAHCQTPTTAATANVQPHDHTTLCYMKKIEAAATTGIAGEIGLAQGDPAAAIPYADKFGFIAAGAAVTTSDRVSHFAWIGEAVLGTIGSIKPSVKHYQEVAVLLNWAPTFTGPITVPLRIKGQIWGIGITEPRGF